MRQLHPSATHIMAAYRIKTHEGSQDDREYGASYRMLETLKTQDSSNAAVSVVRYHKGPNIGPRRHVLIEKVVMEALTKIKAS